MANSKYEYVRTFERSTSLLPNTFLAVRLDGRGFHRLSAKYKFEKPNDRQALCLMNAAATAVVGEIPDISFAYGISDEYSFIFDRSTTMFERRESKILTTVVSTFTAYYISLWPVYFSDRALSTPLPSFDGRVIEYPTCRNVRDYLSWRQVDCHINNLYNTTFWAMVLQGGLDTTLAEEQLKGTLAADKNEILFSRFKINYNNEAEIYKKGSVIYRDYNGNGPLEPTKSSLQPSSLDTHVKSKTKQGKERNMQKKASIVIQHRDIIKNDFWNSRPWLLTDD